jgi:N-acetylglucosaminyldiphosphoundecaprenol N-acetyl-beta-D-mannosaminyltransferase
MKKVNLLNVSLHNITMIELLERLRLGGVVFTTNVDHLMKLQRYEDFYQVYQDADYRVCDSKVLVYASHFLGTPIYEKISGSDLFPAFYKYYQYDRDIKIFLLGSEAQVVKMAQQKINYKIGRKIIVAAHSPSFGFEKNEEECQQIVEMINQSGANVLAIGVGAPKQEMWIAKYKNQLNHVKTFLAIGATINFEAGIIKRSPQWVSEIGFEWLYRLLSEPKRLWRRYLLDAIPFCSLLMQQKLQLYKNPWPTDNQKKVPQIQSLVENVKNM